MLPCQIFVAWYVKIDIRCLHSHHIFRKWCNFLSQRSLTLPQIVVFLWQYKMLKAHPLRYKAEYHQFEKSQFEMGIISENEVSNPGVVSNTDLNVDPMRKLCL